MMQNEMFLVLFPEMRVLGRYVASREEFSSEFVASLIEQGVNGEKALFLSSTADTKS